MGLLPWPDVWSPFEASVRTDTVLAFVLQVLSFQATAGASAVCPPASF